MLALWWAVPFVPNSVGRLKNGHDSGLMVVKCSCEWVKVALSVSLVRDDAHLGIHLTGTTGCVEQLHRDARLSCCTTEFHVDTLYDVLHNGLQVPSRPRFLYRRR